MAPELELPSLGGVGTTRLSQFRGRPVLLTMFMSKCRICEKEIRDIERLHRGHLQKGLIVLGVSVDPDRETLRRFVKEKELTFFVLEDFGGEDGQAGLRLVEDARALPDRSTRTGRESLSRLRRLALAAR